MREPAGMNQTSPERRLFPQDVEVFSLKSWNERPAPKSKVVGFGDTEEGVMVFLGCGHSMPYEDTDDIPRYGVEVGCERCKANPPISADGAIR